MEVTVGAAWRAALLVLCDEVRGYRRHVRMARKYIAEAEELETKFGDTYHTEVCDTERMAISHLLCAGVKKDVFQALLALIDNPEG